jgi:hypothetical protein
LRAKDFPLNLCINNLFNQQLITIIMNKSELIAIAADAGITKAAAKLALESFWKRKWNFEKGGISRF